MNHQIFIQFSYSWYFTLISLNVVDNCEHYCTSMSKDALSKPYELLKALHLFHQLNKHKAGRWMFSNTPTPYRQTVTLTPMWCPISQTHMSMVCRRNLKPTHAQVAHAKPHRVDKSGQIQHKVNSLHVSLVTVKISLPRRHHRCLATITTGQYCYLRLWGSNENEIERATT